MTKEKKYKLIANCVGAIIAILWVLFTVKFNMLYQDIIFFATDGAHPLVQVLEIIGNRGNVLLPYLLVFFVLVLSSFLFYIVVKLTSKVKKRVWVNAYELFICILILLNCLNKLAPLLLTLVIVSVLLMYSLVVTVNYLYFNDIQYEVGDVVHTEGPFESEEQANECLKSLASQENLITKNKELILKSEVYVGDEDDYYIEIYLEDKNN